MVNEILFTSLFGHMPREGEGMCTEEHKKVCFQVLTTFFYANPGIRVSTAFLSHKYYCLQVFNAQSAVFVKDATYGKEFLFFFPSKNSPFQTINSFSEIMDTMKQNHFNELHK